MTSHPATPTVTADLAADLILYNGSIVTVDDDFSIADAIAIKNGRIVGIGRGDELQSLSGPRSETVDLRRRMAMPGLNNSHGHPYRFGLRELRLNLMECRSIAEVLDAVARRAAETPPGAWVEAGIGWREDWLAEKRLPTRAELDSVAPDHPVCLPHLGYTLVLNSAGLQRAGITRDMPVPEGSSVGRDAAGDLDGSIVGVPLLRKVEKAIPPFGLEERLACLKMMCRQNLSWGTTSVLEAGLLPHDIRAYQALWQRGELNVRTSVMMSIDVSLSLPEILDSIRAWGVYSGMGDDLLRVGGIKMHVDGGIEGALLREPYAIDPTYYGQHSIPRETLRAVTLLAAELGWNVGVHACGGGAMDLLLEIYEEVDREIPIRGRRFGLLHGFHPTEENFEKIKRLGLVVPVQPPLLYNLAPNFIKFWGRERTEQSIPLRAYLDHGIRPAGGIDGTPFPMLLSIWSSVTRGTRDAGVIGPEHGITREEAIRMHTLDSAYVTFEEQQKGSLEVGKLADLIVLDRDILTCPADEIKDTQVLTTLLGGQVVHGSFEALA
jgi:predicted amidohydrolase YtcJ